MSLIALAAASALLLALPADAAGDRRVGRQKAVTCQGCHGIDGLSKIPEAPNIAGQPLDYLVAQIKAYRDGGRQNEVMSVAAQGLGDQDIADLAAWYSAIEVEVTLPQR